MYTVPLYCTSALYTFNYNVSINHKSRLYSVSTNHKSRLYSVSTNHKGRLRRCRPLPPAGEAEAGVLSRSTNHGWPDTSTTNTASSTWV